MTVASEHENVCVGVITSVHGVRGNVKVKSYTANAEDFASYGELRDASGKHCLNVEITGRIKDQFLVKVKGVNDRNAAEALRGMKLFVSRSRLPETAAGEFYYADLIGMVAKTPDGKVLGTVKAIYNFGAGDMLEIEKPDSDTEFVGFTDRTVPCVDLQKRELTVDMPDMVEADAEDEGAVSDDRNALRKTKAAK
ncbi:ribosome maturation factor RimM [Acetobacter sp. CAG:977]|nr:ribosome maturation factor RimM [Acetobacter sp. CAG:977]